MSAVLVFPEKMEGDIKCGDPVATSVFITDATGEHFCR